MEKYQIVEGIESTAGAGGKARDDISIILDKMNFKRLIILFFTEAPISFL